ncbi:MAG TPA: hypothetical protein VFO07_10170, partial [Roseiflexaceae bacterium]|nr:hypothetical protein [Roseiflexaceae bacterium]
MPYAIADIEITQPLPTLVIAEGETGIALVVRRAGRPIDFVMHELPAQHVLTPAELARLVARHIHAQAPEAAQPAQLASHWPAAMPTVTIAICTRDNPQDLASCLNR